MKWLLVLPILSYRGAERVAIHLSEGLIEKNHQVTLFFVTKDLHATPIPSNPNLQIIISPPLIQKIIQNSYIFTILAPFITLIYLLKYAKSVDIIQTESFPCLFPSVLVAKIYRKKIGWIIHDLNNKIPDNLNLIQKIFFQIINNLNIHFSKQVALIIALSEKTYQNTIQQFPGSPIFQLLPPVNFKRLDNPDFNIIKAKFKLENRIVLLTISALHILKNQSLAIQSLSILKKIYSNITLILVGSGSTKLLTDLANQLNLTYSFNSQISAPKDIIFAGFIEDNQVKNYYAVSDLVLITSHAQGEGLNITGFESLFLNKLCLTTKGAGISQIFDSEKIGLVTMDEPEDYAKTIQNYLDNPQHFQDYIKKGSEYVKNNLSIPSFTEKIIKVYTQE